MKTLGATGLVVLPIVCCAGLPLLIAAGVSVAVAVWFGGIAVGVVVLLSAAAVLGFRLRRRAPERFPSLPARRIRT